MLKVLILIFSLHGVALAAPSSSLVSYQLQRSFETNDVANVFVTLKEDTSQVLATIQSSRFVSRSAKLNALHSALLSHAERTQEPIQRFLTSQPQTFQVKSYWITNQIYIQGASSSLVSQLVDKFSNLISNIDEEFFAHLIEPVATNANVTLNEDEPQWGVVKIQAPEAWKELGGIERAGEGVVICTVDSGVRGTHEALRDNFVGDYGWFDPDYNTLVPTDHLGHGTHTTGTIVGRKGIGVAPGAKWMSCRGCAGGGCAQHHLTDCGQFIVCPTHSDGSNPDCSKAPHIVSNSWSGGRANLWFNGVIETWHTAGVTPVFSIGNNGPSCDTANSPGDQDVIGVGSVTINDEISEFSSIGPSREGRMKPDVSGPGTNILSAFYDSDTSYAVRSGTSMACPHVSGTIALLKTRYREISYEEIRATLFNNADRDLKSSGNTCDGLGDDVFPNHSFGYGRINALKTIRAQGSFRSS